MRQREGCGISNARGYLPLDADDEDQLGFARQKVALVSLKRERCALHHGIILIQDSTRFKITPRFSFWACDEMLLVPSPRGYLNGSASCGRFRPER